METKMNTLQERTHYTMDQYPSTWPGPIMADSDEYDYWENEIEAHRLSAISYDLTCCRWAEQ